MRTQVYYSPEKIHREAKKMERELTTAKAFEKLQASIFQDKWKGLQDELTAANVKIAELNDHLDGRGIHTHSENCQRAECKLRRELGEANARIASLEKERDALRLCVADVSDRDNAIVAMESMRAERDAAQTDAAKLGIAISNYILDACCAHELRDPDKIAIADAALTEALRLHNQLTKP